MSGGLKVSSAVLLVGFLIAALPRSVAAGPGSGGGVGSGGSEAGSITATVSVRTPGTTGSSTGCSWERFDGEIAVTDLGVTRFPFTDEAGRTFNLWKKTCGGGTGEWFLVPDTEPEDLLPGLLEQLKAARLPKPVPTFLSLDPVNDWAWVTVPMDFRAGGDSWRSVSVTASIGPVWATVTAVPTRLTFDPGDPAGAGSVSCGGDAPLAGYDPAVPGECSYTYRNASSTSLFDGYHFETTTSVYWSISWSSSTGAGGVLEPYSTSASALLAVAEVKGLVTCTGSRPEQGGC